ncbi:unnamed protein product [Blepharisma stoltei]|uniref:Rab-GAP TBC domain-containing protein n=1 Tax=Blepharisma stoltei TaxID=1481888 RepID=A0AAU9IPQ9_9CILI|nr:unnamed protein product [Blepharisma stoltei]
MATESLLSDEYVIIESIINEFTKEDWISLLEKNDLHHTCPKRIHKSLLFGIPDSLRGQIWPFLARATHMDSSTYKTLSQRKDTIFEPLIQKDLARTFPDHEMYKDTKGIGQSGILRILRAYAQFDNEIGYCQGMAFIVGLLLIHIKSEELTFWTFVSIMWDKNWREVFKTGTPKLVGMLDSFSNKLQSLLPEVHCHLQTENLEITCFSPFFITIFGCKAPIQNAMRVIDMFLYEGEQVLYSLLLNMLTLKRGKILRMNFEELFRYFNNEMAKECLDEYNLATLLSPVTKYVESVDDDYDML